jgi:hypothetical protein
MSIFFCHHFLCAKRIIQLGTYPKIIATDVAYKSSTMLIKGITTSITFVIAE